MPPAPALYHVMDSANFVELIAEEGAKLGELHARLQRAFFHRECDSPSHREWDRAAYAFRTYVSPLDPYIERARKKRRYSEGRLLEFVVAFLEVDPWFFGSGYLKEGFLTRLKRSDLDEAIRERLRRVLLDAVERRGAREFQRYCRLAAVIPNEDFVSALQQATASADGAVASRARRMLGVIRQRRGSPGAG